MTQKEALEILKMGHNVFITGAAGSGKTYLLNEYVKYLRSNGVGLGITASTGIAATHMGGVTIHSWTGMGIKDKISGHDLMELAEKSYLRKRFDEAKVLVIDEVSMLHHYRLDLVDQIAKAMKRNQKPFGGMQVVLCGDFFQLPPVSRFGEDAALFAYHSEIWKSMDLKICYLEEQHRQNDSEFSNVLNAIRDNKVGDKVLKTLKSRFNSKPTKIEPTKLYSHNNDVDFENEKELLKLKGELFVYDMTGAGKRGLVETLEKSCLAPKILRIKKGARVMFVKNNFEEGYVNGTLGVVEHCDERNIKVKIASGRIIEVKPAVWVIEENDSIKAQITQYPLRLAWAITVHKSQGMSLDAAEIDLSRSFERGMGYVALSRVRSLSGLSLLGFNEMALRVSDEVRDFDQLFREESHHHCANLRKQNHKEVEQLKNDFLISVGAGKKEPKKKKGDTYLETKKLLDEGFSIFDIVETRDLTMGTIISHLEKLRERKQEVDWSFIFRIVASDRLEKIKKALLSGGKEEGKYRLVPAMSILGSEFSFEEVRLVRLLLD